MTDKHYKLEDKRVVETDFTGWSEFFESPDRIIKQEALVNGLTVSTVFLGIDHNWGEGEPLLFESMVFGLGEEVQQRYSTYEQAEQGHQELVKKYST